MKVIDIPWALGLALLVHVTRCCISYLGAGNSGSPNKPLSVSLSLSFSLSLSPSVALPHRVPLVIVLGVRCCAKGYHSSKHSSTTALSLHSSIRFGARCVCHAGALGGSLVHREAPRRSCHISYQTVLGLSFVHEEHYSKLSKKNRHAL